jgi:hypothetical protein
MIRQEPLSQGEVHLDFWTASLVDASYVYVIQGDAETPIKVGTARDVEARINALQTGNPQRLRLLHVLPGDYRLEWNFHQRLKPGRVLGEWFAGEVVDGFLRTVEHMANSMVAAHPGGAIAPHFSEFGDFDLRTPIEEVRTVEVWRARKPEPGPKTRKKWRVSGPVADITVRHVEPSPKVDPEVARETRALLRGLPRSAYLDAPNALMHRRISPSEHFGN